MENAPIFSGVESAEMHEMNVSAWRSGAICCRKLGQVYATRVMDDK